MRARYFDITYHLLKFYLSKKNNAATFYLLGLLQQQIEKELKA